jgi:crotonobetainyl-CoA:carnitine CoA-transferase CaiB-like acyl-CoA transferase
MDRLLADAHVFVQGYRPGALRSLGYSPEQLAERRPGVVCVSLSAWGRHGPWKERRGFDSLVQTATGFNVAEGQAHGEADQPRALPMQINDQAAGYLIAFGAAAALRRQQLEGGSWHVQVSLAQTAHWIRQLGRVERGFSATPPSLEPYAQEYPSSFGALRALRHSARLSRTPAEWTRPSVRPGDSPPHW